MTSEIRELSLGHGEEVDRLGGSAALLSEPHVRAFGLEGTKQRLASFVMVQIAADEADIVDIATDSGYRRSGFARLLMRHLLANLAESGIRTVHLDVDETNAAALALYRSTGFIVVGRRKGYYSDGKDAPRDAILMAHTTQMPARCPQDAR